MRLALEDAGYEVHEAADGAAADQLVRERLPHLVVLDVVMPYVSGLELLKRWRSRRLEMGVIVLTAYGDEDSVADALEAGADDHIAKPFQVRQLVERVNAVLRRTRRWEPSSAEIVVGDVRLDLAGQRVVVGERVVPLSKTEVAVLRELMIAPGVAISSQELLGRIWGPQYRGDAEIVRTNIYRLRRKLNPRSAALDGAGPRSAALDGAGPRSAALDGAGPRSAALDGAGPRSAGLHEAGASNFLQSRPGLGYFVTSPTDPEPPHKQLS